MQPQNHRVAHKWVASQFGERYARLFFAMSLDQAKVILGFPPQYAPTPQEISKAYKLKAFENHPDRGGDTNKMVEINVAKDILEGKSRWQPEPSYQTRTPYQRPAPVEPDFVIEGQSFEQAWAANGPPAGVDWKFVSTPQWSWDSKGYGVEFRGQGPGQRVWVFYGQTDSKHVFMAIKERGEGAGTVQTEKGRAAIKEDWQVSFVTAPLSQNILKIALKYIKSVATGWADGSDMPAPKKYIAWSGARITDEALKKIPRQGGAALKDILVGTGLLDEDSSVAAGRKSVVEVWAEFNQEKRARIRAERGKVDGADSCDFFVRVNGKAEKLSDDTVEKLKRKFIPWAIGWDFTVDKTYNLTRMRGSQGRGLKTPASLAIQYLVDCLTSEPSWLVIALEKAAEEYSENT
jgi:hypothetical protein